MQTCARCQSDWLDTELSSIEIGDLVPGQIVPSGRCPGMGCGGFCFPKAEELTVEWMEKVQLSLNTMAREINTTRELLNEVNATPACFAVGAVLADCLRMVQRTFAHEFHLTMITEEQAQAIQQAITEAAIELEEAEEEGVLEFPVARTLPAKDN